MDNKYLDNQEYHKLFCKLGNFAYIDDVSLKDQLPILSRYKMKFENIYELHEQISDLFSKHGETLESVFSYLIAVENNVRNKITDLIEKTYIDKKVNYYKDGSKLYHIKGLSFDPDPENEYLSIDLKSASWQAIRNLLDIDNISFVDFIINNKTLFPDIFQNEGKSLDYFLTSKKFRSAVLTKIETSYQNSYNKLTLMAIATMLFNKFGLNYDYYLSAGDEILIKLDDSFENVYKDVFDYLDTLEVNYNCVSFQYIQNIPNLTNMLKIKKYYTTYRSGIYQPKFLDYNGKNILKIIEKHVKY